MALLTLTLGELIDRALMDLVDPGGQGRQVVLGSDALSTTSDTQFTLVDADGVNQTDVVEFGSELVLVTEKSADADPILTVSRGYYTTTAAVHAAGTVGHVNPTYPRKRIAEAIRRSFGRLEALGVPVIKTSTVTREAGYSYAEMPGECREVYEVLYWGDDGRLLVLDGWAFHDNLPTSKFSTGKSLNLPNYVADADELEVKYRAAYRWSEHPVAPTEASTIQIPEGAEDLPALYAAAWLVSSREISRSDIDRAEEWSQTAPFERGQSSTLVRAKWQEFYRALDEARRLNPMPQPITYRRRPRF
jgi:hypothetical protein